MVTPQNVPGDELYKNRSSRKTDSQYRSTRRPFLLKIVSGNRFSGKTYFYTIGSRLTGHPRLAARYDDPYGAVADYSPEVEGRVLKAVGECTYISYPRHVMDTLSSLNMH